MFRFFLRNRVDPKRRLAEVLGDSQLPSFNGVVLKVLDVLRDPDTGLSAIARELEPDPGMTVRVLRTVNSAAFSPNHEVTCLSQAVSLIGRSHLESLVLSIAVAEAIPSETEGFDSARFWRHASWRAAVGRRLARRLHPCSSAPSFTACLLQDLAVPLLAHSDPGNYVPVLEAARHEDAPLHERERSAFGWDHSEVGTWVCSEWGLPESLAGAIGAHHGRRGDGLELLPAVELASLLEEREDGGERFRQAASEHFDTTALNDLLEESYAEAGQLAQSFA